ncbi:MAG: Gfo/Idh/MocA family oxidoreductase [Herpetosiphonaceae bacterium]|nr:Gfo/Idh/MocA family oxidoreductase [Herpetosiphonaceae bacterium]
MQRLRIGIVGCGEVTQVIHLPSLEQLNEQFVVTALCDVSNHVLEAVGQQWRVANLHHDYQHLLLQDDVDAVLVANPEAYHAEVGLAAIAAGKHVLIEKPMCMTLREAAAISAAQERAGVTVQVGYMRRYAPAFLEACRLLPELGEIRLARAHDVIGQNALIVKGTSRVIRGTDVPPDIIAAGQRLHAERLSEALGQASADLGSAYGLMLGLSSHDISAMRELLGMPQRVLYAAQRHGGLYLSAAFDYGTYVCHYETGIDTIPRFDAHLEVYGNERILRVQYDTPYVRNLPIRVHVTEANGQGGVIERAELPAWGDAFVAEWQAFYTNVVERRTPKTSPADFRQDLELFHDMIALMRD